MAHLLIRMTGLGTCGFTGTAEQEFFPWPAAPPCPAGLVLVSIVNGNLSQKGGGDFGEGLTDLIF